MQQIPVDHNLVDPFLILKRKRDIVQFAWACRKPASGCKVDCFWSCYQHFRQVSCFCIHTWGWDLFLINQPLPAPSPPKKIPTLFTANLFLLLFFPPLELSIKTATKLIILLAQCFYSERLHTWRFLQEFSFGLTPVGFCPPLLTRIRIAYIPAPCLSSQRILKPFTNYKSCFFCKQKSLYPSTKCSHLEGRESGEQQLLKSTQHCYTLSWKVISTVSSWMCGWNLRR